MAARIKSYISTSVDITQASADDSSKVVALQALNQIFSPKVVVWWQPKTDPKVHYLAVFETAEAAKGALNTQHPGWAVAPLNDAGKRALAQSLENTIKLYPNTFRRARAGKGVASSQPPKAGPAPQMHQAIPAPEPSLQTFDPAPLPVSQRPPVPATFAPPQHSPPQVLVSADTSNTIDAVVDQANSVEKAIRALVSQKELVFQQRNQLIQRSRELELSLTTLKEENTSLREKNTRQEQEIQRLQAIIDSQPPPPITRDVAVDASPEKEAIPPAVAAELKELCLALVQKDMALADKERTVQEMSRSLEEEVGKREAAEGERNRLTAEWARERARIPAVLELYAELEKMAVESLNKRENNGKAKEGS
ncbi:hypothetical protein FS837_003623 [Tulasnella sp. UAMH 9824]|nr:hypothetical protein FS837_003623 [Tulasnella sp. UAMH 9824]